MAGLLEPYIPNFGDFARSAAQGYALGDTRRQRRVASAAGGLAAGGNLRGARDALFRGGELDEGFKIDDRMAASAKAAKTEQLEKAAKFQGMLGQLAMLADTPEKWGKAITALSQRGVDVSRYRDFASRDLALAESGKVADFLKGELDRRKQSFEENKPIEVDGRLVRPRVGGGGYEEVYSAPEKDDGLMPVPPGTSVLDKKTRQPVFTAPERPQKQFSFTKTGIGNEFTGEFKPYEPGQGDDPEVTLERGKYEQGLRKEYTDLSKNLRSIQDSLGRIRQSTKLDTGAGDIAMVYSYMKMLDPDSTVMQGEYATAEQTGGIPERVTSVYNKIISGQRLTPEQRRQFLQSGEAIAEDKLQRFGKLRSQFEDIARKSGVDPARIMLDEGMAQAPGGGRQGGTRTRIDLGGGGQQRGDIPQEAVQMLRGDPSPEAQREFDEQFGPGSARRALGR